MSNLGLGLSFKTNPFPLAPSSQYTGTNALVLPRLDTRANTIPLVETQNGNPAGTSSEGGITYTLPFKHYSPLFTNLSSYETLAPKYFPYASSPYPVDNYGPRGPHLIKQFGTGSTLISFNNNFDRTFPDPPMRQITSNPFGAGTTTTDWTKYEMYQIVDIPVGATVVNYGAMILCPGDDDLRPYNFGGMYIFAGDPSGGKWSVDFSAICGSSVPILPASQESFYINYKEETSDSLFMWAGPSFGSGELVNRWNSNLFLRGADVLVGGTNTAQRPASDYRTWTQLNVRIPLPLGGSGNAVNNTKLGFSMYFAESRSYLSPPLIPPTAQSGSIWIYDPYVVFS